MHCRRGGPHTLSGSLSQLRCVEENNVADLEILSCTISAGQTASAPVGIGVKTIVGLVVPPVWTSGALTFRASPDGVSFLPVVDTTNGPDYDPGDCCRQKNRRTVILENRYRANQ
jgi:hypothetical protein